MNYTARQHRIEAVIRDKGLDALLVTHLPNVRYLSGFTGSAGLLVVGPKRPVFFTDGRYTGQARDQVERARVITVKRTVMEALAEWLLDNNLRRVGIESDHMTVATRARLAKQLRGQVRLRNTSGWVERERMVKDADELALIRRAVNLGAELLDVAVDTIRPGATELEVAAQLEYEARKRGAEAMSFETIIAAGERSALPHGRATAAAIPERGFVVLDFGVILGGYCSDMTRTVRVGKMSDADEKLYNSVRHSQQAATEAVHAGAVAGNVDAAARRVLTRAGFGKYFSHSTGHGVGLEIHEAPRLGRGQTEPLQPGMVVTIEPGAYIPGCGGVRIEDMVVVTPDGCEVLTPATKELIQL